MENPAQFWVEIYKEGFGTGFETLSGSLELGVKTDSSSAWMGEMSLRFDGFGSSDFEGVSARAYLDRKF